MGTINDYQKEYLANIEEIKLVYNVDHVVNYDQLALYTAFKRLGLNFHDFENEGQRTYTNGTIKVLAIDFEFYFKRIKQNPFLTGYNKTSLAVYRDKNEYYDEKLNLILPVDDEQAQMLADNYKNDQKAKKEWALFEEIKPALKNSDLGTQFNIGESVYWHFLEVLPPIYGKQCFYCSEPIKHTNTGQKVYHCLRRSGDTYTIEENVIK